jgi:hypothetical protein
MGGLAWALSIRKKRDPSSGREIPVHWDDYTPLLIAKPVEFRFDALVRDDGKMRALAEMFAEAEGEDTVNDLDGILMGHGGDGASGATATRDFFVTVRDTPPDSPVMAGLEKQPDSVTMRPASVEKRKLGSVSGSWPNSLLAAQGPIVVR